jgi:type IV pilus assembly protein PilB
MTVEDPVEYRLPHIIQIQVNADAGLTFANVLRAFLRQDPNVMLVGEIRDGETADIAIKAALTGHLVISTLHTNDGPSTIARLVNMGVDPVYVGTSVLMVSSQKLLRKICEHCKDHWEPEQALLERANLTMASVDGLELFRGRGCEKCHHSGYSGRFAVHEVLKVGSVVRAAIFRKANLNELRAVALGAGMTTMREVAMIRWKEGKTTLEEVLAETQYVAPISKS